MSATRAVASAEAAGDATTATSGLSALSETASAALAAAAQDAVASSATNEPPAIISNAMLPHPEDSRFSVGNSWLLRLFKSEFFNEWMAISYLQKYSDNEGIQDYLCERLSVAPIEAVSEFLPQLCHILITNPSMHHLEALFHKICRSATHFATQTSWILQCYMADLENFPNSIAYQLCNRLLMALQLFNTGNTPSDANKTATTLPETVISPEHALNANQIQVPQPPPNTPATFPVSLTVLPASASASSQANANSQQPKPHALMNSKASRATLEELHRGKAFSFSHFLKRLSEIGDDSSKQAAVASEKHNIVSGATPLYSQSGAKTATLFASVAPKELSYQRPDVSETATPSSPASQSDIHAPIIGRILSSPPKGEDWETILRRDPRILEKYYFHAEMQFMSALSSIADRLLALPRDARQSSLVAEITLLNDNFPAPVCVPIWCSPDCGSTCLHHVTRIAPTDAIVLDSAERVPFLILVEVIRNEVFDARESGVNTATHKRLALLRRKSLNSDSREKLSDSNEDPQEEESILSRRNPLTRLVSNASASRASANTAANSNENEDSSSAIEKSDAYKKASQNSQNNSLIITPSVMSPDLISDREFSERMRTAAIMLAQLALQENENIADAGASNRNAARTSKKRRPQSGLPTEEIRARIIKEMMALDETRARKISELKALPSPALPFSGVSHTGEGTGPPATFENEKSIQNPGREEEEDLGKMFPRTAQELSKDSLPNLETESAVSIPTDLTKSVSSLHSSSETGSQRGTSHIRQSSVSEAGSGGAKGSSATQVTKGTGANDQSTQMYSFETWERKIERIRMLSPYGEDPNWNLISVIVKSSADLRQEQFAFQLVRLMKRIWAEAGVDCWVYPFKVMVTGPSNGMIETVRNTVSLHSLKKMAIGKQKEAFTLRDFFEKNFGRRGSEKFSIAQTNFLVSLAGYSILTYVLNIKDRHNGNILLDYTTGHIVHIDFGFMLSNSPGRVGFETAPFKLPYEYLDLLDGYNSPVFLEWRNLMVGGLLALRREHERILGLVEIMEKDSPMSCFAHTSLPTSESFSNAPNVNSSADSLSNTSSIASSQNISGSLPSTQPAGSSTGSSNAASSAVQYPVTSALRERLLLGLSDTQVEDHVDRLISSSLGNVFTRLYDSFQYYTQGVIA